VDKDGVSLRNVTFCGKKNEGGEDKNLLGFGNLKDISFFYQTCWKYLREWRQWKEILVGKVSCLSLSIEGL